MNFLENLEKRNNRIIKLSEELFIKHSKILYYKRPNTEILDLSFKQYRWKELSIEGKQLQSTLYNEYNKYKEIVRYLLQKQVKNTIEEFEKNNDLIIGYIEYTKALKGNDTESSIYEIVSMSLKNISKILRDIFSKEDSNVVVVPDTNALLQNNQLAEWKFDEFMKFEILLLPTVLSELDKLKIDIAKPNRSSKATTIIRQIKEYRRRGKLTVGVNIVKDKITLRTIAIEPNFKNTLEWLDVNNQDDRIIASFLEVVRDCPNNDIRLVTSDINLQNKMEFAELPFIETP